MNLLSEETQAWLRTLIELSAALFIFTVGLVVAIAIVLALIDRFQTRHAVRRNYPLLGRFRYLFEHLGEFFRQYFFAQDREELPFNRAQRAWVYRAAKGVGNTVAFGSTADVRREGSVVFVNGPWPPLDEETREPQPLVIGPASERPFTARRLFNISAMSYGALSKAAVRALSHGARQAGCWLNTGEGGLAPWHLEGGCDLVFQIGTARYGVRDSEGRLSEERLRAVAEHSEVRMFEVKLSQGAKPGKGGILPAVKVTEEIAAIRGIPAHQASVSPNRHPDVDSPADLLDLIDRVRTVTGRPCGFKAVIGTWGWLEELAAEVHRRGLDSAPDFITVDGAEGGSGAAPMSLLDGVGMTLYESLPRLVDLLVATGLRERVRVIASGKLITARDVAWALAMGADFVNNARGFMFALGCIQAMRCNRNTCPTGVTTHDPRLQRGLVPEEKAVRVASYQRNMEREVAIIAHSCGVAEPRQLRREHVRLVVEHGRSVSFAELFPPPAVADSWAPGRRR